jgi:hypothetical protein
MFSGRNGREGALGIARHCCGYWDVEVSNIRRLQWRDHGRGPQSADREFLENTLASFRR